MDISQQVELLLSHLEWWTVFLPLPFFLTSILDVLAWRRLLPRQVDVPLVSLFGAQLGAEAILQSVPGGFALADALKTLLLKRRFNVLPFDTLGSLIIRHWTIGLAQVIFTVSALALSSADMQHSVSGLLGKESALFASIALLVGFTFVLGAIVRYLVRGTLAASVWSALFRIPSEPLRRWLKSRQGSFYDADVHFKMLGDKSRWVLLSVLGLYLLLWTMETFETLLVARSVGFHLRLVDALALEALLSVLKLAVFFLPSGIGAKDVGYFALFASFGVNVTTVQIGSFVIFKRLILLFWLAIGYLFLLAQGVRPILKNVGTHSTVFELR